MPAGEGQPRGQEASSWAAPAYCSGEREARPGCLALRASNQLTICTQLIAWLLAVLNGCINNQTQGKESNAFKGKRNHVKKVSARVVALKGTAQDSGWMGS